MDTIYKLLDFFKSGDYTLLILMLSKLSLLPTISNFVLIACGIFLWKGFTKRKKKGMFPA